jgi:hypothetical protein
MSCLFESLSSFIQNMTHENLRKIICDFLITNPVLFDSFRASDSFWENSSLKDYVDNMRSLSTWGSALEIKAFCELFKINVIIHHNNRLIEFKYSKNSNININLGYTGNHYFPINAVKI